MIKVESKFKDFGIQIPTDISEITSEALDAVLTNVVVAKHYCVVALCQNESLFGVINNKVSTVEVMPIIAKISKEDALNLKREIFMELDKFNFPEKIEKQVKTAFPQAEVRYVYTSSMIRKKLAKQGQCTI